MQLDECIALPAPRAEMERAMRLSLRWAERSQGRLRRGPRAGRSSASSRAATTRRLRVESAEALAAIGFDGYAIGGLAVGEPQDGDAEDAGDHLSGAARRSRRAT